MKLMMRLLIVLVAVAFVACNSKKEDAVAAEGTEVAEADQKEWKEMDDFHMVMAETFHPYKDSSNLEPAKSKAAELQASAEKWAGSTLPKKVDNDGMKGKLEELKNECASLTQMVTGGDDKAIGEQLTKVHDMFHAIQEEWYGGHGEGHKHEH